MRGYDAGKKVKGRKRHILVDTMGLLLIVHTANIQDRDGAKQVLEKVTGTLSRLNLIWADGGYTGQLVDWVKASCGWVLEIVKRNDDIKGFQVLPHRWVVEWTFGWLGRYRRLSKDYEGLTQLPAHEREYSDRLLDFYAHYHVYSRPNNYKYNDTYDHN